MPNIKSAFKRVKKAKKETLINASIKSRLRTEIRKAKEAIVANREDAGECVKRAIKLIDKAAAKRVIHKNTAARKKSQLALALNKNSN